MVWHGINTCASIEIMGLHSGQIKTHNENNIWQLLMSLPTTYPVIFPHQPTSAFDGSWYVGMPPGLQMVIMVITIICYFNGS